MNYKLILFMIGIVFFGSEVYAQQAIVASGGNATGTGGISNYSIGQVSYTATTGSTGSVNQGVQQAFEIFTLGTDNFPKITLKMVVYPNPTTSVVNLKVDEYDFQNLQFQLFDIQGREITKQKVTNSETPIDVQNLPSATYLLQIISENRTIKTFKIIKNN